MQFWNIKKELENLVQIKENKFEKIIVKTIIFNIIGKLPFPII